MGERENGRMNSLSYSPILPLSHSPFLRKDMTSKWLTGVLALIFLFTAILGLPRKATTAKTVNVVTSSTDFVSIAKEIGKDRVEAFCPFKGYQEPELWVEEVFPSWMLKAAKADLYIRIGLMSDIWADVLIEGSRNQKIFPGEVGYVDASTGIEVLDVPTTKVDRAQGEIHLQGNPHYLLDPLNAKIVADNILEGLIRVSPENADFFRANAEDFKARIDQAMQRWQEAAKPLEGAKLVAYHETWTYLARRFGFKVVGYCEPKPGVPPTPVDLEKLIGVMKTQGVKAIIKAPVYPDKIPNFVAGQTGARVYTLPAHVEGVPEAKDYFALFDYLIAKLNEAVK
jgi:zinc/manganese transport system substrate-binding protein